MRYLPFLLLLAGCVPFTTGPDLSSKTVGPMIVNKQFLEQACGPGALGCTNCTQQQCVIYILEGAPSWVFKEEEWHSQGGRHP